LLIDEEMNVRVATLAQDADPDSFIRQQGLGAFNARIEGAQSLLDFKFNWLGSQFDLATVDGKAKISQELLGTIARFKSEVAKYELTKSLAQKLNVPESVLLKQAASGTGQRPSFKTPEAEIKASVSSGSGQELLLALFLKDPAWVKAAQENNIGPDDFSERAVHQVVDVIWSLVRETGDCSTNDLLMRLSDEAAQSLVTRLISIEEGKLVDPARVFTDCVGKIQKEKQKKVRVQLMEAIREAEVSKDTGKLDQLREQFNQSFK
jgi:DNA primase